MRVLDTIVPPSTALMAVRDPEIAGSGAIRPQVIGDQPIGNEAVFRQKLAHQFQRRGLIPRGLDQDIQNLAFAIDGTPQVDQAPTNLEVDFVQMPDCARLVSALA